MSNSKKIHGKPSDKSDHQDSAKTDDAAEYGERIETGKAIHRGGKTHGAVPGATEQNLPDDQSPSDRE